MSSDLRRRAAVSIACAFLAGAACSQPRLESATPSGEQKAAADSIPSPSKSDTLAATDLYHLRSVGDVHLAPNGSRIWYSVINNDRPGRPYSQVWIVNLGTRQSTRLGSPSSSASGPRWSPDGRRSRISAADGERRGLMIADADGSGPRFIAPSTGTNHPLPISGDPLAWSPDGRQIAFVSVDARARAGRERRPDGHHAIPVQADGRRRADAVQRQPRGFTSSSPTSRQATSRQLTSGDYYEHSIDWSPDGDEILVRRRTASPIRSVLQLRRLRGDVARRLDPAAHRARRAPSTARRGRPTAAASRIRARRATSPRRRRRWRTRMCG